MTRPSRTCDGCHKPLRKADMYETLNDERFQKLCPSCFDLWLDDKLILVDQEVAQ